MSDLTVIAEPGQHDVVVTRSFDAPRDVVFKAMTSPEYLSKWWGLKESETIIDRAELRRGGSWRFVERMPDGQSYAFRGVIHDLVAPERFVQTFEYEGMPGHVCLETHDLEERDGRTLYTSVTVFQSVEDRDGMVESGMEEGLGQSMDSLDELVAALR